MLYESLHVIDFFLSREKDDGGFGASPRLPATIEDTYYALRTLRALKDERIDVPLSAFSAHEGFLVKKLSNSDLSYRSQFQLFWCLGSLGIKVPSGIKSPIPEYTEKGLKGLDLEDLFYLRRMGYSSKWHHSASRFDGSIETVKDLRMFLYCYRGAISSRKRARWLKWLAKCQNPDGGIGFMPGTTSFTENCYYGLKAAELLGGIPFDSEALTRFILSTRSGRGGFGRQNLGVPFPSSTWHALGSLMLIKSAKRTSMDSKLEDK